MTTTVWNAACTSIYISTSEGDIVGASVSVVVPVDNSTVVVTGVFDMQSGTDTGECIGYFNWSGVDQSGDAVVAGPAGTRDTVTQTWVITGVSAGTYTAKLRGSVNSGGMIRSTHTTITAILACLQGPAGATGPQGATGPTGSQGPAGPTGQQGLTQETAIPLGLNGDVGSSVTVVGSNQSGSSSWYQVTVPTAVSNWEMTFGLSVSSDSGSDSDIMTITGPTGGGPLVGNNVSNWPFTPGIVYIQITGGTQGLPFSLYAQLSNVEA